MDDDRRHRGDRPERLRSVHVGLGAVRRPRSAAAATSPRTAVDFDPEAPGSNDANWCNDEYDALYQQQQRARSGQAARDRPADAEDLLRRGAVRGASTGTTTCRPSVPDRWENFVRQPEKTPDRCCSPTPRPHTSTLPSDTAATAAGDGGNTSAVDCGVAIGGSASWSARSPVEVCGLRSRRKEK